MFLYAGSASAFVERLVPNFPNGSIPCHGMGAILRSFISPGGPSGAVLAGIVEREWVPGGFTAQDNTDNAALIALLNAQPTQEAKEGLVQRVEDFCILWEMNVDELDSPSEYRNALGIE